LEYGPGTAPLCRETVCCRTEEAKELRLLPKMYHLLLSLTYVERRFHEEFSILAADGFWKYG
jgi:hypothetical protein